MANYWKPRTEQECTKCGIVKPLETGFYPRKKGSHLYVSRCRDCMNETSRKRERTYSVEQRKSWHENRKQRHPDAGRNDAYLRKYGLTVEDYNNMYDLQKGLCYVCKDPQRSQAKRLVVDHCHQTGKVRGLLCNNCNWALGLFEDDIVFLQSAIEYIMMHSHFG